MEKMMTARELVKKVAAAVSAVAAGVALLVAAFLSGRRRGRTDTAQRSADAAALKKEAEIEKTDAIALVDASDRSDEYRRRKDELIADFVRKTKDIH